MPHAYTEDQLVEQPAIGLFAELGWSTVSALEEAFGATGTLLRETKGEVVLVSRLRAALERLNSALPPEAITAAVDDLTRDRSAMSLEAANREVYRLLKEGIPVSVMDADSTPHPGTGSSGRESAPSKSGKDQSRLTSAATIQKGGQTTVRVQVVDWEQPENNDFLLVSQFSVTGALYTCRPDLVGFVNGLPLVVIELKKPGVPARAAFDENLTHYKAEIPQLFWFNALLIASNGTDSRVGSLTADWERFFEWKRIEREDEPRRVSLETIVRGTCDRTRLLDLVENFTLFSEHKAGLVKIIGQNHQFLGVNNAIASMLAARKLGHGRGGVFWQTQGSGKSFSMVFFAQKVLRKVAGNWTFVVVTDRVELDDQIAKTFKATGAVSEAEGDQCHAASGAHLRELLRGNHRYVFTLIHKFRPESCSSGRESALTPPAGGKEVSRLTSAATSGEVIESYNTGSRNIEELFEELLKLSRNLSEEQQRHVRENMTEEELVIFDILTRPAPELSEAERAEVKKVARVLLDRLNQLLVLNWRQKSGARAQLKLAIEDTLDTGLPRAYDKPLYEQKCSALFEHIYESYPERDAGVYAEAG